MHRGLGLLCMAWLSNNDCITESIMKMKRVNPALLHDKQQKTLHLY